MTSTLTPDALNAALPALPGWSYEDGKLTLTRELPTFLAAMQWVEVIGEIAEYLNHHPDIDIRWRTVTLRTCTHEADDGITEKDIELATRINQTIV